MISRRELYAAGLPFGDSATRQCAGRFICGGGGGGGDSQSTTMRTIPDELKGAATSYSNLVTQMANTPYTPYTGTGVADLNQYQTGAINQIAQTAGNNQLQGQTEGALSSYLSGGNTNPYLDQMVQKAQDSVKRNMASTMVGSGSFGNSGVEEAMGRALGDTASTMYGNAYNTDQSNRLQAISMSPTIQNSAYTGANQLLNAGNTVYNNAQDKADFNYQQYQNQQNYPLQQISAIGGGLNNMSGSTTTQSGGGGK